MSSQTFSLLSPVSGTVLRLEADAGQTVADDDVVAIVESMKMEIPVEAERAGALLEWRVKEGDAVEEGAVIAVLRLA